MLRVSRTSVPLHALDNLAHISFTGVEPAARSPGVLAHARMESGHGHNPAAVHVIRRDPDQPQHPFIEWILRRAGLRPAAYRSAAMQRRVPACLRQLRVTSVDAARDVLERQPELLSFVLNTALIGVSEFFRDRSVFDFLEETVLPELLKTRTGLRVCGAGVSGGQEIYSMAILLAEAGVLEQSTLLGVDCRIDAISGAREGLFDSSDMAGVKPGRRDCFFRRGEGQWAVSPVLKNRIQWWVQDLLTLDTGGLCDLILFRNVAIYFNDWHSAEAWTRLCGQLAPGGFLVTGKAERPPASLPLTRVASSIYRKNQL